MCRGLFFPKAFVLPSWCGSIHIVSTSDLSTIVFGILTTSAAAATCYMMQYHRSLGRKYTLYALNIHIETPKDFASNTKKATQSDIELGLLRLDSGFSPSTSLPSHIGSSNDSQEYERESSHTRRIIGDALDTLFSQHLWNSLLRIACSCTYTRNEWVGEGAYTRRNSYTWEKGFYMWGIFIQQEGDSLVLALFTMLIFKIMKIDEQFAISFSFDFMALLLCNCARLPFGFSRQSYRERVNARISLKVSTPQTSGHPPNSTLWSLAGFRVPLSSLVLPIKNPTYLVDGTKQTTCLQLKQLG